MSARTARRASPRKSPAAAVPSQELGKMILNATLDRAGAPGLAQALLAARGASLDLDASEVRQLGAQCAQVLLSARRTWRAEGHDLRLVKASHAFTEGVRLLGLTTDLGE